jgi:hypothetical protein
VDFCRSLMRGRTSSPMALVLGLAHRSSVSQPGKSPGTGACPGVAVRLQRERGAVGMSVIGG